VLLLPALSLLLSVLLCEAIDWLAQPARSLFGGGPMAFAWRAAAIASIWLLAFGLTGRALFAAVATAVTVGILVAISNAKRRYLREPMVFSDFALLEHIVRHPRLFYIPPRWAGALIAAFIAVIATIVGWMTLEPRTAGAVAQLAALLAVAGALAIAVWSGSSIRASAAALVRTPNIEGDVARIGLLASLAIYAVLWRHEPVARPAAVPAPGPLSPPYDAVIVLQAEAFIDLRRLGRADLRLPAFDGLRRRALACGLLEVPCQGAYTLRPESAVITGCGFHQQGFDRFHPYLRPDRIAANALPRRLAQAGWDTLFVHPYDGDFFRRNRAMPALGFVRFADEREFAGARRAGPYICDEAVADFLLSEIRERRASGRRLFAYAVTMEAHDPYGPGRLPDEDDPVRQYIHHIENADRMLARLVSELDGGDERVLLVFFGDHVPFLPAFADPFSDARTDYVVAELGRGASRDSIDFEITRPEHLHALIERRLECAPGSRQAKREAMPEKY
jgi:phosphoglycerol transferase MdoB-like AlkP superfamily enzyme